VDLKVVARIKIRNRQVIVLTSELAKSRKLIDWPCGMKAEIKPHTKQIRIREEMKACV
jgi:hypothetical protein